MIDKIRAFLDQYSSSFFSNRGIGKTASAIKLAQKSNGILLCPTSHQAKTIKEQYQIETCTFQEVNRLGSDKPIIIDQDVAIEMSNILLREYYQQHKEVSKRNKQLAILARIIQKELPHEAAMLLTDPDEDIREIFNPQFKRG